MATGQERAAACTNVDVDISGSASQAAVELTKQGCLGDTKVVSPIPRTLARWL
jgi:hypothetical protein